MTSSFEKHYQRTVEEIQKNIIIDIEILMLSKKPEMVPVLLNSIKTNAEFSELRFFNLEGKQVFVREEMPPDPLVKEVLKTGLPIFFRKELNEIPVFSGMHPIENKPQCQKCHGTENELRGVVLLSLSMNEMLNEISHQRNKYILLFLLITTAVGFISLIAINRFFIKPLKDVQLGAEAVEKGQLNYKIHTDSTDEIGVLAERFNNMALSLSDQFSMMTNVKNEWQSTVDSITDFVYVHDKKFNIIRTNNAFAEHFGFHPKELINKNCRELFQIESSFEKGCPYRTTSDDDWPKREEILEPKTNKIYLISSFPFHSPDEETVGILHVIKDITEEREREMQLILNDRLANLGQLSAGLAHEINNPLSAIAGCTEGLLKRIKRGELDIELSEKYLTIINEEILRCKRITTSMLSFVRKKSFEKKPVNINDEIDKTLEIISLQGRMKNIRVTKNYSEKIPFIHGSEDALRQVFMVIISNALDAMEDEGAVTLSTGCEDEELLIEIRDTGAGIAPENLNRIFDPFFTTRSEKGGTGLGLSLAHRIVANHGGAISVRSVEEKGTTFKITLPI
jgi:PAS domain S-box-containing protein